MAVSPVAPLPGVHHLSDDFLPTQATKYRPRRLSCSSGRHSGNDSAQVELVLIRSVPRARARLNSTSVEAPAGTAARIVYGGVRGSVISIRVAEVQFCREASAEVTRSGRRGAR